MKTKLSAVPLTFKRVSGELKTCLISCGLITAPLIEVCQCVRLCIVLSVLTVTKLMFSKDYLHPELGRFQSPMCALTWWAEGAELLFQNVRELATYCSTGDSYAVYCSPARSSLCRTRAETLVSTKRAETLGPWLPWPTKGHRARPLQPCDGRSAPIQCCPKCRTKKHHEVH